ncbi:rhomboid family intramembrane serine protease [Acrocarpospora sp. B8E8]|uniref:rhomboid family intramembrane serine protease n=1 Tax=Acrocarpospora sp. B8E8 TaxID=3153572 RepID=UPI00325D1F14
MSNDQIRAVTSPAPPEAQAGRRHALTALIAVNVGVAVIASVMIVVRDGFDLAAVFYDGVSPLHEWGELNSPAIEDGAYWRLLTSMFLHYGVLHLLANLLLLWLAARRLEPLAGSGTVLTVYLLSGLGAAVAVYYFDPEVLTAGASGAVFGLIAALLVVSLRARANTTLPLVLLGVGLVATFAVPGMSIAAHAGGLLVGTVLALGFGRARLAVTAATAVLLVALAVARQFL